MYIETELENSAVRACTVDAEDCELLHTIICLYDSKGYTSCNGEYATMDAKAL